MLDTKMAPEVETAGKRIIEAGRRLVQGGVLSRSQHGNISVRLSDGNHFVLTGGGTLDNLAPEDLAVLDLEGNLVDGQIGPASNEIIHMHAAVYKKRPDLNSVIHTHSPHITAFALASKPIELSYEALVRFDFTEAIPVAKYGPRGSARSVANIVDVVGPKTKAVLLENHGLLAFDENIEKVVHSIFILEESAEMILLADAVGGAKPIPSELIGETRDRRTEFEATGTMRRDG
ncbi:MAG: class II aldolase/adducin family protein [Nitrolancea sp.]